MTAERKLHVMFLCSDLNIGGIQRVVVNLARGLVECIDLDLTCAVLHRGGAFRELLPLASPNFSLEEIGCTSSPLALFLPNSKLIASLKKLQPDVVISFGHMTNLLAAWAKLRLASRSKKFKLIASEHSTFGVRSSEKNSGAFTCWRRLTRAKMLYRQAEFCACVSYGVADDLIKLGIIPSEKARVIYNPIVDRAIHDLAAEPCPHEWLNCRSGHYPCLVAVGRFVWIKGYDILLRALHCLRSEKNCNARLILIGDGPARGELESLTRELGLTDAVYFAGYQGNPYKWISRASLLVLSSRCEGFGNVLPEAMTLGVNIVSTDCPSGPREILENGKWGRLVPVEDDKALASAIHDVLSNSTLGTPGAIEPDELIRAAERFSMERSIREWHDLIFGVSCPN